MEKEGDGMKFDLLTSMALSKALKQNGIDRGMSILDRGYCDFTLDELAQIKKIEIKESHDISFLRYLPNLKCLVIENPDYNRVIGSVDYVDNQYFNQISDFSVIRELTKLEELRIENDVEIRELDVRGLTNLRRVSLINNPRLESVLGMDEQHHLESVEMYGNNIVNFPNMEAYLYNTLDAKQNTLDVSIFFTFIHSIEDAKKLYDMYLNGMIHLKFAEKNGLVDFSFLTIEQITSLYIKFKRLFDQRGICDSDDFEKIGYVFRYVMEYIRFASTELQEREKLYFQLLDDYQRIPEFYKKNMGSLHNSFNTYHFKRGNCEGIVNLMRFMLGILEIPTENVHCHDKRYTASLGLNHALLRAKCGGRWLYYDATYDRKNWRDFFGKTYEEISQYVDLSVFEQKIREEENYGLGQYNGATVGK